VIATYAGALLPGLPTAAITYAALGAAIIIALLADCAAAAAGRAANQSGVRKLAVPLPVVPEAVAPGMTMRVPALASWVPAALP
jgi:hypothetical protein